MHDCKNIDTFIPGKMGKFLEKSGKSQGILSVKKSENPDESQSNSVMHCRMEVDRTMRWGHPNLIRQCTDFE